MAVNHFPTFQTAYLQKPATSKIELLPPLLYVLAASGYWIPSSIPAMKESF